MYSHYPIYHAVLGTGKLHGISGGTENWVTINIHLHIGLGFGGWDIGTVN